MAKINSIINFIQRHRQKLLIGFGAFLIVGLIAVVVNYQIIGSYHKYIVDPASLSQTNVPPAIVFGGGIEDGKPRPLLKDRLDTASKLLKTGKVRKLLLSGDNRFKHYDEPGAMYNYLVKEQRINPSKLQMDSAGRSTYETCERAQKIFSIDKAILISESTHLPRAIYTCRAFGIEAIGVRSDGQSSAGRKIGQRWREVLARTKAAINLYLIGEPTVLGDKIEF